jgi:hypothetical protein
MNTNNKTPRYFNLNEFKNGKTATTMLGNPVKFICMTGDKILIKVYHRSRVGGFSQKYVAPEFEGTVEKYNLDGRKYRGTDTWYDLTMEAPKTTRPRDAKGRFTKK